MVLLTPTGIYGGRQIKPQQATIAASRARSGGDVLAALRPRGRGAELADIESVEKAAHDERITLRLQGRGKTLTLAAKEQAQRDEIFDALHQRLAPATPLREDTVGLVSAIYEPLGIAIFTPVLAAGLWWTSDHGGRPLRRKHFWSTFVGDAIKALGPTIFWTITALIVLASLYWLSRRILNPPARTWFPVK